MYLLLFVTAFLGYSSSSNVATPLSISFNNTHYFGYDGPWQAVSVLLSSPQQPVNLYPGGTYANVVLSKNVADFRGEYTSIDFPTGSGIFNASLAQPGSNDSTQNYWISGPNNGGVIGSVDGGTNGGPPSGVSGYGQILTDQLTLGGYTVSNASISAAYNASHYLPDGRQIPLDVGILSLGASNNQFFGSFIANMVPLTLSATGIIPSNTWGLHIGSVYPYIPGSLVFGGYDKARVIGTVSKLKSDESGTMFINLIDISLGVVTGDSPFSFTNKSGLLQYPANNNEGINTRPNPTIPYLYLPDDTCKAIASNLPVNYLPSLDLYTWNTSSPNYTAIVRSPAYLGFTFSLGLVGGNLTIKVPFSLLNLTLTAPLVNSPIQYFPCKSYAPAVSQEYHLGRAFLQAAFLGMNWHDQVWWMAQAPGPSNLISFLQPLENSTDNLQPTGDPRDSSLWPNSWKGVWIPISESSGTDNGKGLSAGAKIGIAVGAVLAVLILAGAIFYFRRRTKKNLAAKRGGTAVSPGISNAAYGPAVQRSRHQKSELADTSLLPQRGSQTHYELEAYH